MPRSLATAFFVLLCFLPITVSSATAQLKQTKRVLIVNDLGIVSSPGFAEIDQAILSALQKSPYQIELYDESLQLTFFPDEDSQRAFLQTIIRKYSLRKPDLIIAAGSQSFNLIAGSLESFIRETPIIFCELLGGVPDYSGSSLHVTGVMSRLQPEQTLEAALHLFPGTKHVVVVGGTGKFDEVWERVAKQAFQKYESKLEFTYLTDLTMPALLERLKHLPPNSIVYHTSIAQDAEGERFIGSAQSVPLVTSAANAPVFVMDDVDLRAGTVGGSLVNWVDAGRVAGEMAVRVLNGQRPEDIPIEISKNAYMFDWRALKRWGVNETDLPDGSILLNRQPTFWELYKRYVLAVLLVLLAQATAIAALLWQRARRRKAEAELIRSEEKFSRSFRHSPLAISIVNASTGRYVEVNESFELQTGWTHAEVIGQTPFDIGLWINPDQRTSFMKQVLTKGNVKDMEVPLRRKDGQVRTSLGSAELIEVHGEPCVLSVFADISERKQAEEAMSGFSRRLIEAQETERTRIARELHDDINQRLALVAVTLKTAKQTLPSSDGKAGSLLEEAGTRVSDLENDIQGLSHRLHSSKLEYLGLEVAASGFCKELAQRQNLKIDFQCDGLPEELSGEVSLCLFRVLQEALHNAAKYSGVDRFEVSLTGASGQIQLRVHDAGVGFDLKTASNGHGLGLTSMRERLKLVSGELSIDTKPGHGTTVLARVPLADDTNASGAVAANTAAQ
jgi:PAS domain S-box-containing protein